MKIRKTWVLATVLAFAIAGIWSAGVARAAIDSYQQWGTQPAPPVKGEKAIKSRPGGPAATGSSSGGGGHHK
jgi:hypothetical protein